MAVSSRAVNVTTSAAQITSTPTDSVSGQSLLVYNNSDTTVYIGGSNVTTANGAPVPVATWSPAFGISPGEAVYAIHGGSGNKEVRVLEQGV